MRTFPAGKLATLIAALKSRGYNLIGPTLRDGVIDCAEIDSLDDIPVGWTDVQDTGHYRLQRRGDRSCFGYVVGPHSWKRYFYPPDLRLWSATRTTDSLRIEAAAPAPRKLALIGVRSCDLSAIRIQDQVLMQQDFQDAHYRAQRENVFIVAVNCVEPGNNCFCTSMNSGPRAADGYDVALTELIQEGSHIFLAEAGSGEGRELLAELNSRAATEQEREL